MAQLGFPIHDLLVFNSNMALFGSLQDTISLQNLSDLDFDLSTSVKVKPDDAVGGGGQ